MSHRADDNETDAEIYERIHLAKTVEQLTLADISERALKTAEKWGKRIIGAVATGAAIVVVAAWMGFKYTSDRTLIARAETAHKAAIDSLAARVATNEASRLAMAVEITEIRRKLDETILLLCDLTPQANSRTRGICALHEATR